MPRARSGEEFSPDALANEAVFALAEIGSGREDTFGFLQSGIELCKYLAALVDEEMPDSEEGFGYDFASFREDRKAIGNLREKGVEVDTAAIERARHVVELAIRSPGDVPHGKMLTAQQFFVDVTMPMWQTRAEDVREGKKKGQELVDL